MESGEFVLLAVSLMVNGLRLCTAGLSTADVTISLLGFVGIIRLRLVYVLDPGIVS